MGEEEGNQGDLHALAQLRAFLEEDLSLWRRLGDLARHTEAAWIALVSQGNALARETIRRESRRLGEELQGKSATPLERLMIDQIVVLQLEVQYLEIRAAESSGGTGRQVGVLLKRLESAQCRYLAAIMTLTLVRKLALGEDARSRLRVYSRGHAG